MKRVLFKRVGGSIFKYVRNCHRFDNGLQKEYCIVWEAILPASQTFTGYKWSKMFDTERDAALAVDRKLISLGKKPVNILKRV